MMNTMNMTEPENIISEEDYDVYKSILLQETLSILKEKPRYIRTKSIDTLTKMITLNQMINFFYLENEAEIVNELVAIKEAISAYHFL